MGPPFVYKRREETPNSIEHIFSFRERCFTEDIYSLRNKLLEIVDSAGSETHSICFDLSGADAAYLKIRKFYSLCTGLAERVKADALNIHVGVTMTRSLHDEHSIFHGAPFDLVLVDELTEVCDGEYSADRVGLFNLTLSKPIDPKAWIADLERADEYYANKVCTFGIKFCCYLLTPQDAYQVDDALSDFSGLRMELPLLTAESDFISADGVGILCLFRSGALRSFSQVEGIDRNGSVVVSLENPLSFLDPNGAIIIRDDTAGAFSSYGTVFGVVV